MLLRDVLPAVVVPRQYDLHICPDQSSFTFTGTVAIDLDVVENCDQLVLNACQLECSDCFVDDVRCLDVVYDVPNERVHLQLARPLSKGISVCLRMRFAGRISSGMEGFYRSSYTLGESTEYMLVTQFEDIFARRAFPCWDEPSLKAVFRVSITGPTDRCVLSNMPVLSITPTSDGSSALYRFADTPQMSTYLVAWCIAHFDYVERVTPSGIPIRVYTPVGHSGRGRFALDVCCRALPFYDDFFDFKYPLPKLDIVSVPDLSFSGMENFGMITIREAGLLVDDASSVAHRQYVTLLLTHELAHNQFGNIVSPEFWDALWLNEGFATFCEYLTCDYLFPEWNIFRFFVSYDMTRAMELDALESSHPVHVDIDSAFKVKEIFDAISYSKGCAIVRMLYHTLGHEVFRNGVRKYIRKFAFKNATTEDLWSMLSAESGYDVSKLMHVWTRCTGYPVVQVTSRDSKTQMCRCHQRRFIASGKHCPPSGALWSIPLAARQIVSDEKFDFTMETAEGKRMNSGQTFFYRVAYLHEQWVELFAANDQGKITDPIDRSSIVNDVFCLSKAGMVAPGVFLRALQAFARREESDNCVWSEIANAVRSLFTMLQPVADRSVPLLRQLCSDLFSGAISCTGLTEVEGEADTIGLTRSTVSSMIFLAERKDDMLKVREWFAHGVSAIPTNIRGAVLCAVVRSCQGLGAVLATLSAKLPAEDRVLCVKAVGCTSDPLEIDRVLSLILADGIFRAQEVPFVVGSLSDSSSVGRHRVWNWIKGHWNELVDRYLSTLFVFIRILQHSLSSCSDAIILEDCRQFFEAHPILPLQRTFAQVLESMEHNVSWFQRDADTFLDLLSSSQARLETALHPSSV